MLVRLARPDRSAPEPRRRDRGDAGPVGGIALRGNDLVATVS